MVRAKSPITAYVAQYSGPTRVTLDALVQTLREILPHAQETISYSMPCFSIGGKAVAGFAAFKKHCAYLPHSGSVLTRVPSVAHMTSTKGSLHIPLGDTLTKKMVTHLVRARLAEISAVTNGQRLEFYGDGSIKAEGGMKAGALHGAWSWYRQDGTLMRTGRFRHGEAIGVWTTYDRDGSVVRHTRKS